MNQTSRHPFQKKMKTHIHLKMFTTIHKNFIYNNPQIRQIKMFFNKQTVIQSMVHTNHSAVNITT